MMGGFEGGDEAGFWDIDTLPSANNKQNDTKSKDAIPSIERGDSGYSIKAYSNLQDVYDTISFIPCERHTFTIEGCDDIPLESNSIYKAYQALIDFTDDLDIADFFCAHKVVVIKRISPQIDPRGASSDAAAFIHLVKEVCNLILSSDELAKIGSTVGKDVPWFIYNPSVNA